MRAAGGQHWREAGVGIDTDPKKKKGLTRGDASV